jgi:cyclophilin family peptidyl-prolyl cis-trans isomerase
MKRTRIQDRYRLARDICALVLLLGSTTGIAATQRVVLQTSKGAIELELFPDKAPVTVTNFLKYVDSGYYDGVVFHRVMLDFMIQAGGYDADLKPRVPNAPIVNESNNGLHNVVGAVAMARLNTPDSATAQFFVNVADNPELDFRAGRPGYAVFGRVSGGMNVVAAIAGVETGTADDLDDVPIEPVVILSARRLK